MLPGVVVANKIDLEERQRVYIPEGQEFAKSNNLEFVQVSAQRNMNVEKPFETLSCMFHNAYEVSTILPPYSRHTPACRRSMPQCLLFSDFVHGGVRHAGARVLSLSIDSLSLSIERERGLYKEFKDFLFAL